MLCWTVMTGPWLFLGASSCVWVEIMRNTGEGFRVWKGGVRDGSVEGWGEGWQCGRVG